MKACAKTPVAVIACNFCTCCTKKEELYRWQEHYIPIICNYCSLKGLLAMLLFIYMADCWLIVKYSELITSLSCVCRLVPRWIWTGWYLMDAYHRRRSHQRVGSASESTHCSAIPSFCGMDLLYRVNIVIFLITILRALMLKHGHG